MYRVVFIFLVSAAVPSLITAANDETSSDSSRSTPQVCVLPEQPDHGTYAVAAPKTAQPGQSFESIVLNVTCNEGYVLIGSHQVFCVAGIWSEPLPKCTRVCKLNKNPSVDYRCIRTEGDGHRVCDEYEPSGTIVRPECRKPFYYSSELLRDMMCDDGVWNYVPICSPECGRMTPEGTLLSGISKSVRRLPWHAGIYIKTTKPYMQICGGTLISNSLVLSAAHCFWDSSKRSVLPKENYAVALGMTLRPWSHYSDDAQQFDVKDIHLPNYFLGAEVNYQEDIAVLELDKTVKYTVNVRPVCLNFDLDIEKKQLRGGNLGKIAGWNINTAHGEPSPVLKVVEVPYIDIETCLAQSPDSFRPYITADKMCAGNTNGTVFNKGDAGAGLAFPHTDGPVELYYLRGIMSTAPQSPGDNTLGSSYAAFTRISAHESFIKQYHALSEQ